MYLIYKETPKSPMKHWISDWKTKQACLKDARGNALRTIAILTEEEVKVYASTPWFEFEGAKRAAADYCREILAPEILAKEWKIEEQLEQTKVLDEIVKRVKEEDKISWEDYCFIKWGTGDLFADRVIKMQGNDLEDYASFSEEDQEYYKDRLGYTEEEIHNLILERGADNYIQNEVECSATANYQDMKIWIDWAYDRIKRG